MNSAQAKPELSEATVIRPVLDGNADAFCELVRPYQRGIYRKAHSIVGTEAAPEEGTQTAVLKVFNKFPQFRHDAQFQTWLIRINMNEAGMWLRGNCKHRHESSTAKMAAIEGFAGNLQILGKALSTLRKKGGLGCHPQTL
jgi:DNA-directed RNA polymerase specialized sigma24 family protein